MHWFDFALSSLLGFLSEYSHIAYFVLFLGAYFETLIGPGFFIFGEIFFLSGAIAAGAGLLNIWLVSFLCILGGILGDSSSYLIGRKFGRKMFKKKRKFLSFENYQKGERFFKRYGTKGIFLARLLGPLSWITPFLAGVYGIAYKEFIKYNLPAVVVGIGEFMVVGYLFGMSYNRVFPAVQRYVFLAASLVLVAGIIFVARREKKKFG